MRGVRLTLWMTLAALWCGAPSAAEAQTWREVKGENFTVFSDASERRVRSIAWQFEQMRAAMAEGLPWATVTLDRPVVVIAVRDENAMRALAPQYWEQRGGMRPASVFIGGPDRYYIALRADVEVEDQGMNPHAAAYWSYSALVLQRSLGGRLPLWVVNGLAAVLSNTIVRAREVEFGKPVPWMAERAKEGPRLPLAELFTVTSSTPYYRGDVTRERFDAQSWALVQFLIFGYKDNAGPRFDRLIQQLASGVPADAAVASVYGSVEALENAYLLYVQQSVYSYGRLPTNTAIVEEKLPARQASPAEHAGVRASFHATMNRPAEARALIAASRKADAAAPFADDAEALLLDREQQTDQAREVFERAAAAGSTSYWTYYRLASLRASAAMSTDERAALVPWLERATSLNPQSAAGFAFLADIQASVNRTDAAIAASRRALDLDKGNVTHHLRLARLLVAAARLDEARAVARDALPLASPQQRAMLESMIGAAGN